MHITAKEDRDMYYLQFPSQGRKKTRQLLSYVKKNPLRGSRNPWKTVVTKELGKVLISKSVPMRTLSIKSFNKYLRRRRKILTQPSQTQNCRKHKGV